jgi:hypothetical protein
MIHALEMYDFNFFFDGLECAGYSFTYVAHSAFLSDVWIVDSNPESCRSQQARYQLRQETPISISI